MSDVPLEVGYLQDRRRPARVVGKAVLPIALGVIVLYWTAGDSYRQELAQVAIAYALISIGLYLPLALCGSISLAYNAYYAVGAYSIAIWSNSVPVSLWLAIPAAVIISMTVAAVVGLATRKLSGFHLAVSTLMCGIAAQRWLIETESVTGGPLGLGGIPPLNLFGWSLERSGLIALGILLVIVMAIASAKLRNSWAGFAIRCQGQSVTAAEACGVPTEQIRVILLALGAGIAALAGVFSALMSRFVLPDTYSAQLAILVLFMPILGGMGTPWGAVLGAVMVVALTFGFDFLQGPGALTFGVLTLVVLFVAPAGIIGVASAAFRRISASVVGSREK